MKPQYMFPIEWHQNCLENMRKTYCRRANEIDTLRLQLKSLGESIIFYTFQINEALRLGKGYFDSNKFKIKKGGRKCQK